MIFQRGGETTNQLCSANVSHHVLEKSGKVSDVNEEFLKIVMFKGLCHSIVAGQERDPNSWILIYNFDSNQPNGVWNTAHSLKHVTIILDEF